MNDFRIASFLIVANLEKLKINQGMLQLKLKYKSTQDKKHVLLWMPVYDRKVVIDRNLEVTVE